jgi:BirA family transcriptional regulator, biotin operon repressor / biotin---[acetyl-CoA-carboxylase] ligase
VLAQLSLVAGVAVHETISQLAPQLAPKLKWPNDVLIDGAKICGILIESSVCPSGIGHNVVVGIGLNLAHHPALPDRPATSLATYGTTVAPRQAWQQLSATFAKSLDLWSEGDGFSAICQTWQARAVAIGTEVSVKTGATTISGRFGGLDSDGAMLLELPVGQRQRITFGDVHIGAPPLTDAP